MNFDADEGPGVFSISTTRECGKVNTYFRQLHIVSTSIWRSPLSSYKKTIWYVQIRKTYNAGAWTVSLLSKILSHAKTVNDSRLSVYRLTWATAL